MNRSSSAYYDIGDWDDAAIIHVLPDTGAISKVLIGIHGHGVDYEAPENIDKFDDWQKPEHAGLRRAVLDAYLYGIYMHNLSCEKWHRHCKEHACEI